MQRRRESRPPESHPHKLGVRVAFPGRFHHAREERGVINELEPFDLRARHLTRQVPLQALTQRLSGRRTRQPAEEMIGRFEAPIVILRRA